MKPEIMIHVPNEMVSVSGVAKRLTEFGWSPYAHIRHVEAWPSKGKAEVEFEMTDPDGDGPLPFFKPPNEWIGMEEFQTRFGEIMAAYEAQPISQRVSTQQPPPPRQEASSDAVAALERKILALEARIAMIESAIIDTAGG